MARNDAFRPSPEGQIRHSRRLIAKFVLIKKLAGSSRQSKEPLGWSGLFYFQCIELCRVKWHISAGSSRNGICGYMLVVSGVPVIQGEPPKASRNGYISDAAGKGVTCHWWP
jgi:hypothetical protein